MREFLLDYVSQLQAVLAELDVERLKTLADKLHEARLEGRAVYVIGNGGSAATASHFTCDFVKGAHVPSVPRFRMVSLTDNVSMVTAVGNDYSYDRVFTEQLDGLIQSKDMLLAITASGNSPSILRAVELAKARGAYVVGLIGFGGGKLKAMCDLDITVSSTNYGPVEDLHLILDHILSQYLRRRAEGA